MSELECNINTCENRYNVCAGCPSGPDVCIDCWFFLSSNYVMGYCYKHERRILVGSREYSCLQYKKYVFNQIGEKIRLKFIKTKHFNEFPKDNYNQQFK